ncbi:hypothetical protein MTO96_006369 [Rhipicephalus appendiculatus]
MRRQTSIFREFKPGNQPINVKEGIHRRFSKLHGEPRAHGDENSNHFFLIRLEGNVQQVLYCKVGKGESGSAGHRVTPPIWGTTPSWTIAEDKYQTTQQLPRMHFFFMCPPVQD